MPDIPSRLCSDCGTVIEPMPDDRLCPKCGHKFPDKHTEDIERLTEILQANPGQCPACGCEHIRKITEGKAVVGDRICMKCQCLWSPQWSKSSGYLAAIMGFAIAVPAIGIALCGVFSYCFGQYKLPWHWHSLYAILAIIVAIVVGIRIGKYGLGVIGGTKGHALVRRIGPDGETADEDRP